MYSFSTNILSSLLVRKTSITMMTSANAPMTKAKIKYSIFLFLYKFTRFQTAEYNLRGPGHHNPCPRQTDYG